MQYSVILESVNSWDASVNTNYNNKILKNPSSIEIKVQDIEWKTTGQNVRPQNEIPESQFHG